MAVILLLLTILVFLVFDHFSRPKAVVLQPAEEPAVPAVPPRLPPVIVAGFQLPENLRYHPGHSWALSESPNLVRVGIDDFAGKLLGRIESIMMPRRGQWVRQGQKIWTVMCNGKSVEMVSPVEGVVAEVNETAVSNPELARKDPYGEGWLIKVESPDAQTSFRNLLGGALARLWTQASAQRLQRLNPAMAGALAQDGGVAVDDLTAGITDEDWTALTKEFFLA